VPARLVEFIEPEVIAEDPEMHALFVQTVNDAQDTYSYLLQQLEKKFAAQPEGTGKKKAARQAARAVLPNATETRIVVTGNYRALRHFLKMRASEHADVEIRALAIEILRVLHREVPNVFGDFEIKTLPDGTEIAESPFEVNG
jgi:thymidylate synthase (FAD)